MNDSNDDRDYMLAIVAALIIGCLTFLNNASGIAVANTQAVASSTDHSAGKRRLVIRQHGTSPASSEHHALGTVRRTQITSISGATGIANS